MGNHLKAMEHHLPYGDHIITLLPATRHRWTF